MTLSLATRGYLSPQRIIAISEGPEIVASSQSAPDVRTSTLEQEPAPRIRASKQLSPGIQGAVEEAVPPPAAAPSGTGTELVPIIRSAKKE